MAVETWDYSIFWKEAINQIRQDVTDQEWMMWFNNLDYDSSGESKILLRVPSAFYRDQVKQRYLSSMEERLFELAGNRISVDFIVRPSERNEADQSPPSAKHAPEPKKHHGQLRADYVFDNFVIGENNSFAANAAYAIARNPGTAYNPCLVYGGVGLGKTHLVQSIGNTVYQESDRTVVYVTAETFTNEFIQSIKNKTTHRFKSKYRSVDILLIDDIHFLQNKIETQEELFHTFNALYDSNKQMVFTCDRPVSELKHLSDRLRNRFERGLNVDLQPPNFETRFAILKQKIEQKNVAISDEVIDLICQNITTNVRDLEASLTKLIAYSDLVNKNITLQIAQAQLKDVFSSPR